MIKAVIGDDLWFNLPKSLLDKTRRRQRSRSIAGPDPIRWCILLAQPALHRESIAFPTMIQRSFEIRLMWVSPGRLGVANNPDVHGAIVYQLILPFEFFWKGGRTAPTLNQSVILLMLRRRIGGWTGTFPRSEKMRMTERYRRTEYGRMTVEVTFEDTEVCSAPLLKNLSFDLAPQEELIEYVCENNKWAPTD